MDIVEKRKLIHEYIDRSDEETVESLYSYLQRQKVPDPAFIENYNTEINSAMERIDKGFFITHEDVEKEAEQW